MTVCDKEKLFEALHKSVDELKQVFEATYCKETKVNNYLYNAGRYHALIELISDTIAIEDYDEAYAIAEDVRPYMNKGMRLVDEVLYRRHYDN